MSARILPTDMITAVEATPWGATTEALGLLAGLISGDERDGPGAAWRPRVALRLRELGLVPLRLRELDHARRSASRRRLMPGSGRVVVCWRAGGGS